MAIKSIWSVLQFIQYFTIFLDDIAIIANNNSSATKRSEELDKNDEIEILYEGKSTTNKHASSLIRGKFFTSKKRMARNTNDILHKNNKKNYLSKRRNSHTFWKIHDLQ